MIPTDRRVIFGAALAAALVAGAAHAEPAGESRPDIAAARIAHSQTDRLPSAAAAAPVEAHVPTIRELEAEDAVSGGEPDPESFDRAGLEAWWRHFQERSRNPD